MNDRLAIGGNNPPAVEQFALHIEDLFALVSGSTTVPTTTDEQEAALDALLDDIRKARKDADAQRATEKQPHLDAGRDIDAAWKPNLARCDAALAALKDALTPYRTARQAAKDAAAAKAREEAAAKLAQAQEALRGSGDLDERFAAEEALERAGKLTAVANRIDRSATGLRTYWQAEVTDRRAALNHYIAIHPEAFEATIQALADQDARGARPRVPGIAYHERKRAA